MDARVAFHVGRYARHKVVERGYCQVKQWRELVTRQDGHARYYTGALTALLTWLP